MKSEPEERKTIIEGCRAFAWPPDPRDGRNEFVNCRAYEAAPFPGMVVVTGPDGQRRYVSIDKIKPDDHRPTSGDEVGGGNDNA